MTSEAWGIGDAHEGNDRERFAGSLEIIRLVAFGRTDPAAPIRP